jgi:hypothetical protein
MNHETVVQITINKVIEALGHGKFNNNIQLQVQREALAEIELREKYAREVEATAKSNAIDDTKNKSKNAK